MEPYQQFEQILHEKITAAFAQHEKILKSANWIADTIESEGIIYCFGTGHSHILAEEIFYRAGGLTKVYPILDPDLMLHKSASGSTMLERKEGYAASLLKEIPLQPSDVLLVFSNSGRNAVCIEMAMIAQEQGSKVIALTNFAHSSTVKSRHSSGKKLYEIADLYLDNFGEVGDAALSVSGVSGKTGATSTIIGASLLHAIIAQAIQILAKKGISPEIFGSSNSDEHEKANAKLIKRYGGIIPGL